MKYLFVLLIAVFFLSFHHEDAVESRKILESKVTPIEDINSGNSIPVQFIEFKNPLYIDVPDAAIGCPLPAVGD